MRRKIPVPLQNFSEVWNSHQSLWEYVDKLRLRGCIPFLGKLDPDKSEVAWRFSVCREIKPEMTMSVHSWESVDIFQRTLNTNNT